MKVWYAPYYKLKIPNNILEQITTCYKREGNEELNQTSINEFHIKNTTDDDYGNLFSSSSTILTNAQILETPYLPTSNLVYNSEYSNNQTSNFAGIQETKVLTCSIPFPSSLTTSSFSSSSSTIIPLISNTQSLVLVPMSFSNTISSLSANNLDTSLHNRCISLISRNNEVSISSHNLLAQEDIQAKPNSILSSSCHDTILEAKHFNAKASLQTMDKEELKKKNGGKIFNLNSLQSITINKNKIAFTYEFPQSNCDNYKLEKVNLQAPCLKELKLNTKKTDIAEIGGKKQTKTIFVKSLEEKHNSRFHLKNSKQNLDNIYLSGHNVETDLDPEYDIISMNINMDHSHTSSTMPSYKIVKKQKLIKNLPQSK